jgi:hypothetical protein
MIEPVVSATEPIVVSVPGLDPGESTPPWATVTGPWFPPAPAPGPASLLELPPDDWALEPKIDGIRVIWLEGRPFTRQGSLLTASKGADRLCQHLSAVEHTLDGEWVPARDEFYAFNLPDCPLTYDERRSALAKILGLVAGIEHIRWRCSQPADVSQCNIHLCVAHRPLALPLTEAILSLPCFDLHGIRHFGTTAYQSTLAKLTQHGIPSKPNPLGWMPLSCTQLPLTWTTRGDLSLSV